MSLRRENFAGIVSPTEPIGPEGGGSFDADEPLPVVTDADGVPVDPLETGVLPPVVMPSGPPAAFCDSRCAFGTSSICVVLGGVVLGSSGRSSVGIVPAEGCVEIGIINAARDSSGVGISAISVDCVGACSSTPGLI